jgi:hypothetical protein
LNRFLNLLDANDKLPVLHYFDVRGRGEAIRLAFVDNNIKFKESTFSSAAWGKMDNVGLKAKM